METTCSKAGGCEPGNGGQRAVSDGAEQSTGSDSSTAHEAAANKQTHSGSTHIEISSVRTCRVTPSGPTPARTAVPAVHQADPSLNRP